MQQQEKRLTLNAGSLWEKTLPNGTVILEGNFGDLRITIWPNQYKKSDKSPTHRMTLSEQYKKAVQKPAQYQPHDDFSQAPSFDPSEDIPF